MSCETANSHKHTAILLVVIVSAGAAMRFYGLEAQSLWNDELFSWFISHQSSLATVINMAIKDVHPPGYYLILYFVIKVFGDSEFIMRIPSAIAGTVSIAAMFQLGRQLYSEKEALVAAALTAMLWCPIFYSQMARAYSFVFLFSILTTLSLVLLVKKLTQRDTVSPLLIVMHIVYSVILSYMHYYGFLLVMLQGLTLAAISLKHFKSLLMISVTYLLIFTAYSPWLSIMVKHAGNNFTWFSKPTISYFFYYLGFFFNKSIELTIMVLAVCLVAFINSCYQHATTRETKYFMGGEYRRKTDVMLLVWLYGPFIFVYMYSVFCRPVLRFYSFMICMPAAYLLLARALCILPLPNRFLQAVKILIIIVFVGSLIFSMKYYSQPHKEDYYNHPEWAQFREAVGFVIRKSDLYTPSIIVGCPNKEFFNYYFNKMGGQKGVTETLCSLQEIVRIEELIQKDRPSYLWFLFADRKPDNCLLSTLAQRFRLLEKADFNCAGVYLFEIKDSR